MSLRGAVGDEAISFTLL